MKKPFFILTILLPIFIEAQVVNKIETINSNEVVIIESSLDGKKWIGLASKGCILFDPITNTSKLFDKTNSSLKSDSVRAIAFKDIGGIPHTFIATNKGVAYMHGGIWDTLPKLPDSKVTDIAVGPLATIMVATEDSGIAVYSSGTLNLVRVVNKSSLPNFPTNRINSFQKRDLTCSYLFCATDSGMVGLTYNLFWTFTIDTIVNTSFDGFPSNKIQSIYTHPACDSNLYIGTNQGIGIFRPDSMLVLNIGGLPSNDITVLDMDSTGTLWIGTRDSGLAFYKGGIITKLNVQNGLHSNKITSISFSPATKDCWIGTSDQGIASVSLDKKVTNKITLSVTRGLANEIAVSTYPQPCNEQINFSLPTILQKIRVQLFSITGEIVKQIEVNNTNRFEMNVSDIPQGMYMYQLESEANGIARGKVLIVK